MEKVNWEGLLMGSLGGVKGYGGVGGGLINGGN